MHLKYQAWIRTVSTDTSLTQAPQVTHNVRYSNHCGKKLWMPCWTFAAVPQRQQRSSMASKVKTGGGLDVVTDALNATQRECDTANICDEPMQRKRPVAFQNRAHPRFLVLPVTANPVSKQIGHHWQHDTAWMCSILTKLTHKLIEVHEVPGSPWYQTLDDMLNMSTAKVKHGIQNLNAY